MIEAVTLADLEIAWDLGVMLNLPYFALVQNGANPFVFLDNVKPLLSIFGRISVGLQRKDRGQFNHRELWSRDGNRTTSYRFVPFGDFDTNRPTMLVHFPLIF